MNTVVRTTHRQRRDEATIPPFQAFLDEHRGLVYRFILASTGPQDADDCFQETFLAALRAYGDLRDGRNLRAWVLTIAANKVIDGGRARSRRPTPVADATEVPGAVAAVRAADGSLDAGDPLWMAVRLLPERQRTAVVLRSVLDRPYAEVAAAMGSSEETARANVHQGLRALRRALARRDDGSMGEED